LNPCHASNELQNWFSLWSIKINAHKLARTTFSLRPGTSSPIPLNKKLIPYQITTRYLGIHLDKRLTLVNYIKTKSLNIRIHKLRRLLKLNIPLNTKLLYKQLIRPTTTYDNQLYDVTKISNINWSQPFQSIGFITNAPYYVTLHYTETLK